ncbi:hypothetical protein [Cochlodiniinecator piscidefendens]|uniref:hypothetical protein n=1 Tax=Cochlodiniinecator piscidefendens TaxID=2715756 RepID=UPI00140CF732|nr:hypothetical protein [Cochlodiniinecator piscidefendens]
MTDSKNEFTDLDALFAEAREADVIGADALVERVLLDAETVQDSFSNLEIPPVKHQRRSLFMLLGGWPGFASFATATVAGVWIGFGGVETVQTLSESYFSAMQTEDAADFLSGYDAMLLEG